MAIIICPECGKQISDKSVACVHCGFPVAANRSSIPYQQNYANPPYAQYGNAVMPPEQEASKSARQAQTIERLENEIYEETGPIIGFSIGAIFMLGAIIALFFVGNRINNIKLSLVWSIIPGFLLVMFCYLVHSSIVEVKTAKDDLELAKKDFFAYENRARARAETAMNTLVEYVKEQAPLHPMCPNCGSMDTTRITTANRMFSIGMVGLASSKIGKQYECRKCKHKW